MRFVILLPVKTTARAKSRLAGLGAEAREALAEAFARDTFAVAHQEPASVGTVVCTADPGVAAWAESSGASLVPDPGELNAALGRAASLAGSTWPGAVPVALCADLPALGAADLHEGLVEAAGLLTGCAAVYVADRAGTGTTLYAARQADFSPAFGPGSAERHRRSGAVGLDGVLPGLRLDVDTPADLEAALRAGIGAHTAAVAARFGLLPTS